MNNYGAQTTQNINNTTVVVDDDENNGTFVDRKGIIKNQPYEIKNEPVGGNQNAFPQ